MLHSRVYSPTDDDLIYHYCDAIAFNSICQNSKLWFNDLFSMNDSSEMHWGYRIWEKAASKRIEKYGFSFIDRIDQIIHTNGYRGLVLGCCFSEDKDKLSQWRAYAKDATGYVIGFKAKDLLNLPVSSLKVCYDEDIQVDEVTKVIDNLYKIKDKEDFGLIASLLGFDLAAFKNSSFVEEQEIRLIHLLDFEKSNNGLKLVDKGGTYFGKSVNGNDIHYRLIDDIPSPYIELDFTNQNQINPIKEIIIGPKNRSSVTNISIYLETLGVDNVKVSRSNSSYR